MIIRIVNIIDCKKDYFQNKLKINTEKFTLMPEIAGMKLNYWSLLFTFWDILKYHFQYNTKSSNFKDYEC